AGGRSNYSRAEERGETRRAGDAITCLALGADGVAADCADQWATAFVEADRRRAGPDDLGFDGEAADLRVVERDHDQLGFDFMVVREPDAGERQVLADDRGRFFR